MYILYSQHLWSYDNSIVNSKTTCAMKQTPCLKTNNQTRKQNQTLNLISMNVGFSSQKVLIWFSYFLHASLDSVNKINKKQTNKWNRNSINQESSVVKGTCCKPWWPKLYPSGPRGGGKEPAHIRCPLTSSCIPWHVFVPHTQNK